MNKYLPIFLVLLTFFVIKATNLGIRASDTNIYFLTGWQLLQGKILYKDIFFTNFPLFPYLSALYAFILNGNLYLYYLTSIFEAMAAGYFIYLILKEKTRDIFIAVFSSALYLFSFIVLSTTDHQTGIFAGSLFAVVSYYFFEKKKYLFTGIFIAFAILTKAYFLPIFLAYITYLLIKNRSRSVYFLTGFTLATGIVLLPSIIFASHDLIRDVFQYSLTRSQGIDKVNIIRFFIIHDFPFFVLLLFNAFFIRRYLFFGLVSIFGILFILFYKDIYFLYLNFLIPFLCLSFPHFHRFISEKLQWQKFVLPSIITLFLFFGFITYFSSFRNLQKIDNFNQIIQAIKSEKPAFLYGVNDLVPALSYATGIPMLNNIIDTNTNIFRKGYLNAEELTRDAIEKKSLLVSHGAYYPEYNIQQPIVDEIFDMKQIEKSCKILSAYPAKLEGTTNIFTLIRCY